MTRRPPLRRLAATARRLLTRRRVVVLSLALVMAALVVLAAVLRWPILWVVIGLGQIALLLALEFRPVRRVLRGAVSRVDGRLRPSTAAGPGSAVVRERAARKKQVRMILASRIFDVDFYERLAGLEFADAEAAVAHYLESGRRGGLYPHPLFQPQWVEPETWRTSAVDPLVTYLQRGPDATRTVSTSPLFDPAQFAGELPRNRFGPLASFVLNAPDAALPYDAASTGIRPGVTLADVRSLLLETREGWEQRERLRYPLRGIGPVPVQTPELREALRAFDAGTTRPLVSVILPTWNRAAVLRTAVESVQAQSYDNWELVVADDGSVDDSLLVLGSIAAQDPRVKVLKLPHRGVGAARNAALAAAQGEYVAFLDSDKVWDREFLRTMLAALLHGGHQAAASAVQVTRSNRVLYRSVPATYASLEVGNSIDQTALVATRAVVERAGGFDTSLRRAVDYDLILSVAELTDIEHVPYVGLRYSEDESDPNRISEAQSLAWNFYVSDRHQWAQAALPVPENGTLSVVVDGVYGYAHAKTVVTDLIQRAAGYALDILLVPHDNKWSNLSTVALTTLSSVDVRIVPVVSNTSRPKHINEAVRAARGAHLLVMSASQVFTSGSLAALVEALEEHDAAAVHPVVTSRTGALHDAGVVYPDHGRDPVYLLHEMPLDSLPRLGAGSGPLVVPGAPLPLLVRTQSAWDVQGMNAKINGLWADIDLSQRIARQTGRHVVTLPGVTARMRGSSPFVPTSGSPADTRMFRELWPVPPSGSDAVYDEVGHRPLFVGMAAETAPREHERWTRALWFPTRRLEVRESGPALRWAIKTAAPADERAETWGDLHFGRSLAEALRRLGQEVVVDYAPGADRETSYLDDVVLTLRGLHGFALPGDATKVLWVISHPDDIGMHEMHSYDLRYAASASWPERVRDQWGVDVRTLLQCTDPDLFFVDDERVAELEGKSVMVGNTRGQFRPAAWHTAHGGFPVALYGLGWEGQVPQELIGGSYVPNALLRRYYRTATWALNDHWADMREHGFVSNRVFDVLASGGRLLTDDVPGLDTVVPDGLLPNGLARFRSPAEIEALLRTDASSFYPDDVLLKVSEHIRREHSFDARARTLLDDVLAIRRRG